MLKMNQVKLKENYGFEQSKAFNEFYDSYKSKLEHRSERWSKLTTNSLFNNKMTLKRFIRKGIPPDRRKELWFEISKANELKANADGNYHDWLKEKHNNKLVEEVDKDLQRTYPENKYFKMDDAQNGNNFLLSLKNVLLVLGHRNPETSYCQGFNFITANLLLTINDEETVYWLLQRLLFNILPLNYYKNDMKAIKIEINVLEELVKKKMPKLFNHLNNLNAPFPVFTTKWFICLFCDVLPIETSNRVFDCLFYEGNKILIRVALALLSCIEEKLLNAKNFPDLMAEFKAIEGESFTIDCHEFMKNVFDKSGSLSRSELCKLREQCSNNVQ